MKNFLVTIAYDGTNYFGWQKQPDKNTVEAELEKACTEILGENFELMGTSRTDRGVHSLGQRVGIKCHTTIPVERLPKAINAKLPEDIRILAAYDVPLDFHPRYNTSQKVYEYKIVNSDYMIPQLRNYAEFEHNPVDLTLMKEAAKEFIGRHDFKSFCAVGGSVKTTVRTIDDITIEKTGNIITMTFYGNGFLYNMVRVLSGTLLYVGIGKIKLEEIPGIIEARDRTKAGKTLAPQGLTLVEIKFKEKY